MPQRKAITSYACLERQRRYHYAVVRDWSRSEYSRLLPEVNSSACLLEPSKVTGRNSSEGLPRWQIRFKTSARCKSHGRSIQHRHTAGRMFFPHKLENQTKFLLHKFRQLPRINPSKDSMSRTVSNWFSPSSGAVLTLLTGSASAEGHDRVRPSAQARAPLEPEHNAGLIPKVALVIIAGRKRIAETSEHVVELDGPDRDHVSDRNVDSAPNDEIKSIVAG
jgi:hypothetical protein